MALYHKYRPKTFDEVFGNESTLEMLKADLKKEHPPCAFLFYGPTGCGKTTLGRIIASELSCKGWDFREIDSADFRGIDTIREIREYIQFKPLEGDTQIWLLDECHKLTNDAQNALLKALEDPPTHVHFILCTTDPEKLLSTIKGRCSQYPVTPLNEDQMMLLLRKIVKAEGGQLRKSMYDQIIENSLGRPRDAIQILDQLLFIDPEKQMVISKELTEKQTKSIELCRALLGKASWKKTAFLLNELKGEDPEKIRRAVLGYCQAILLKGENDYVAMVMEEFIDPFYNSGIPGLIFACYSVIKEGE